MQNDEAPRPSVDETSPPSEEDEIIKAALESGKSSIYTWSLVGTSGSSGFQRVREMNDPSTVNDFQGDLGEPFGKIFSLKSFSDFGEALGPLKANEAVAIIPMEEDIMATRTIQVKKRDF